MMFRKWELIILTGFRARYSAFITLPASFTYNNWSLLLKLVIKMKTQSMHKSHVTTLRSGINYYCEKLAFIIFNHDEPRKKPSIVFISHHIKNSAATLKCKLNFNPFGSSAKRSLIALSIPSKKLSLSAVSQTRKSIFFLKVNPIRHV